MKRYTVLCKGPDDPRGYYSEEVDVEARNPSRAKVAAQAILDRDYDPGMRAVRVVPFRGVTMYSWGDAGEADLLMIAGWALILWALVLFGLLLFG